MGSITVSSINSYKRITNSIKSTFIFNNFMKRDEKLKKKETMNNANTEVKEKRFYQKC